MVISWLKADTYLVSRSICLVVYHDPVNHDPFSTSGGLRHLLLYLRSGLFGLSTLCISQISCLEERSRSAVPSSSLARYSVLPMRADLYVNPARRLWLVVDGCK